MQQVQYSFRRLIEGSQKLHQNGISRVIVLKSRRDIAGTADI